MSWASKPCHASISLLRAVPNLSVPETLGIGLRLWLLIACSLSPQPEESVLIENCQQHCVCQPGKGMMCQDHSCKPGQVCEPSGGVLTCVTKGAGQCGWAGVGGHRTRAVWLGWCRGTQDMGWELRVTSFKVRGSEGCGLRCQTLGCDSRSQRQRSCRLGVRGL